MNSYVKQFLKGPWLRRTAYYMSSPKRMSKLVALVREYAGQKGLAKVRDELQLLSLMARDVATGRYREYKVGSILLAVAALVYVVSPLDVVPDFLIGLGLLDDAAIVAWAFARLSSEVERYRKNLNPGNNTSSTSDALTADSDQ